MHKTYNFNLTPLFLVWSVAFVFFTFVTGDLSLLWWAAAPWLLALTLGIIVFLFSATMIFVMYRRGEEIKITTRKGVRFVRRGAEPRWVVRNNSR